MSGSKLPFRPEIQGLRAVAVVSVLLYHVWPGTFSGGFTGVDVFFVISGYLITGLLLVELNKNNQINIIHFWARRMLRLLPAATLVLVLALVGSLYLFSETEWLGISRQVLSSAFYVQNWYLDAQAIDYLRQYEAATPVQHYWSLSIEEQYYIVWPLLLFLAGKFLSTKIQYRKALILVLILTAFALSLAYSILWSGVAAEGYFKTASRIWELSTGAILAIMLPRITMHKAVPIIFGWIGILAIGSAVFIIDENARFPGYIALWPVMGSALVISAGYARWAPSVVLARQPLRFLGDISYSLYLWHWPVAIFTNKIEQIDPIYKSTLIICTSVLLSIITKYLVEDVFRDKGKKPLRPVRAYALSAILLCVTGTGAGYVWYHEYKVIQAIMEKESALSELPKDYPGAAALDPDNPSKVPAGIPIRPDPRTAPWDMNGKHLGCMGKTGKMKVVICEFGKIGSPFSIVLAGDSHAMHYGPAIQKIATERGWHLYVITKPACLLGDFLNRQKGWVRPDCEAWKKGILAHLQKVRPQMLITSGALSAVYGQLPSIPKQIEGYQSYWRKVESYGTKMVVIRDTPLMREYNKNWMDPTVCLYWNRKTPEKCNRPRELVLDGIPDVMVMAAKPMHTVSVIDLTRYLCDKKTCYPVIGNVMVYRDPNHLTETFTRTLVPYLDREMQKVLNSMNVNRQTRTGVKRDETILPE